MNQTKSTNPADRLHYAPSRPLTCAVKRNGAQATVTMLEGDYLDFNDIDPALSDQENLDRMIAKMIERRSEGNT